MKYLRILSLGLLLLFVGNIAKGQDKPQKGYSLNAGLNFYSERNKIFLLKKEDQSNFRFRYGFNFYLSLKKEIGRKFDFELLAGYGWFKRT